MSQFVYDEIFGSQAKKMKILTTNNFTYYRQMMKIKNKHSTNKPLYEQLYRIPKYYNFENKTKSKQTIQQPKDKQNYQNNIDQRNFSLQRINKLSFKIVKRQNSIIQDQQDKVQFLISAQEDFSDQRDCLKNKFILPISKRMVTLTPTHKNIKTDALRLKKYLETHTPKSKLKVKINSNMQSRIRNRSVQLRADNQLYFNKFSKEDISVELSPESRPKLGSFSKGFQLNKQIRVRSFF